MKDVKIFNEHEYYMHIDGLPFILYILLTIISLITVLTYNNQFLIYGLIPLSYCNMVGCYTGDRSMLNTINGFYFMTVILFFNKIKFF